MTIVGTGIGNGTGTASGESIEITMTATAAITTDVDGLENCSGLGGATASPNSRVCWFKKSAIRVL
jgi:hypothetical protein